MLCAKSKISIITSLVLCYSIGYANKPIRVPHASKPSSLIPVKKVGFSVKITGLFLDPGASNLEYAISTRPLPVPAPNWSQNVVNPAYSLAFDLGLQYNLGNKNESVMFNWLHVNSKDSASASSASNPLTTVGPSYYFGPAEQFLLNTGANSTVKFDVNHASLMFDHAMNLTNHIQFTPFVGLSAAYLKEDISNNYWGTDPVLGPYTHNVHTKSTFTGLGPRVGLKGNYYVTNHFAITGNLAATLLAGKVKYSTDFISTGDSNPTAAYTSMANKSVDRIVPEFDAKFSMLYTIPIKKSGSELSLQAGYMYAVYMNAITQVLPSSLVPLSWEGGTVAIIAQSQQQINMDLKGPFVKLSWKF